jgi:hypothetical protein
MKITRELLHGYLDDTLSEAEISAVEQTLRQSPPLQRLLRTIMQERDRGEHTLGAIWQRSRLSCPTREELGSYLLSVLESEFQDYVDFHLKTIGCAFCQANLADLKERNKEREPKAAARRKRFFESSAGYLTPAQRGK